MRKAPQNKLKNCDYSENLPYSHLVIKATFCPNEMPMFSHKKTCLCGHPVNTANNHILKSQPVQSFIILPCLYSHSNQLRSSFQYLCSMTSIVVSIFKKFISAPMLIKGLLFRKSATLIYLRPCSV